MSVTFFVQQQPTAWEIRCSCGATKVGRYDTYQGASEAYTAGTRAICADEYCAAYNSYPAATETEADAYAVNMSQANAKDMLALLGLPVEDDGDWAGTLPGAAFLGHVLLADVFAPNDEGRPAYTHGNMTHCERPAGYTQLRLSQLRSLAEYADARMLDISWS